MSDTPIELALNRPARNADPTLAELTTRLLDLLSRCAEAHSAIETDEFRASVERWRASFAEPDPWELETIAPKIVAACERFVAQLRGYEGARDAELNELATVLRDVLTTLRGEAKTFDERFDQSTSKFAGMTDIQDIRVLRQALSREVDTLKQLVAERKTREAAVYSSLSKRVEKLEANLKEARDEAATDALTGVANRRSFDRALARLVARAERGGFPFTLALIDVDDFKKINDVHGHQIGDRVLMCVAKLLAANVRSNDLVARYGGEEFALLLEQAPVSQSRVKLQGLIDSVAKSYSYENEGQPCSVAFTYSIGATEYQPGDGGDELVARADEALYQAKRRGKKRLVVAAPTLLKRLLG
ncbi:MAG: diguanylate cyclase [Vicinamibacterales bacterium]